MKKRAVWTINDTRSMRNFPALRKRVYSPLEVIGNIALIAVNELQVVSVGNLCKRHHALVSPGQLLNAPPQCLDSHCQLMALGISDRVQSVSVDCEVRERSPIDISVGPGILNR